VPDCQVLSIKSCCGIAGISRSPRSIHGNYTNALFFDWHVAKTDFNNPAR
jgi:prepilin-type processing-associated H-X9-DG protein